MWKTTFHYFSWFFEGVTNEAFLSPIVTYYQHLGEFITFVKFVRKSASVPHWLLKFHESIDTCVIRIECMLCERRTVLSQEARKNLRSLWSKVSIIAKHIGCIIHKRTIDHSLNDISSSIGFELRSAYRNRQMMSSPTNEHSPFTELSFWNLCTCIYGQLFTVIWQAIFYFIFFFLGRLS